MRGEFIYRILEVCLPCCKHIAKRSVTLMHLDILLA